MRYELRRPYPSFKYHNIRSYGGSQSWSHNKVMRRCGCGVVAALDLLLYLSQSRNIILPEFDELLSPDSERSAYDHAAVRLSKRYFPLIYPVGINGLSLVVGLNIYMRRHGMRYRASWGVSGNSIFKKIESMLSRDIPVILSIGANFPKLWGKVNLNFYTVATNGCFVKTASIRSHYVTVTGMDDEWLRISSWGNMYYINRREYMEYIRRESTSIISNVVSIKEL